MLFQFDVNQPRDFFLIGVGSHVSVIRHLEKTHGILFRYQANGKGFPKTCFGRTANDSFLLMEILLEKLPEGLKGVFKPLNCRVPDNGRIGFIDDFTQRFQRFACIAMSQR
jgi:hypothetical protein